MVTARLSRTFQADYPAHHHLNVKQKRLKWPVLYSFFHFLCFPSFRPLHAARSAQTKPTSPPSRAKWTGNSTHPRYSATVPLRGSPSRIRFPKKRPSKLAGIDPHEPGQSHTKQPLATRPRTQPKRIEFQSISTRQQCHLRSSTHGRMRLHGRYDPKSKQTL